MQFDWDKFQQTQKTLEFQRHEITGRNAHRGIACEIDGYQQGLPTELASTPGPIPTNFTHNLPRSLLKIARKHCNSNDLSSMLEQSAGELRAKFLIDSQNWATRSNPGPGRTMSRRTRLSVTPATSQEHKQVGRRSEQPISTPRAAGVEGHRRAGWPGRGAGGRRQDLAGNTQTISTDRLEAAARPAGPGRASRRRAAPRIGDQAPLMRRAPEGPEGTGGHTYQAPPDWRPPRGLRGLAGLRDDAPS